MCYSAKLIADYRLYCRTYGADIDIQTFARMLERVAAGERFNIPKATLDAFATAATPGELAMKALIEKYRADEATRLEQLLFEQRTRLADAERSLASKPTKKASESKRIASNKVEQALSRISDLKRIEPKERDSRIFPGWFAPVMVSENGRRVVKLMRYQCRPPGKPAFYDTKFGGSFNARFDNLNSSFWKGTFGVSHGLIVVESFYENVKKHRAEGRELAPGEEEENIVLRFNPSGGQLMLVACVWSHWTGPDGEVLDSFAAITDDPPPEVSAAGHDRCIVPIKAENIDAWLNPDRSDTKALYAILKDRETPYYEHRLAA